MNNYVTQISTIQPFLVIESMEYYKCPSHVEMISHFYRLKTHKGSSGFVLGIPDCSVDFLFERNQSRSNSRIYGSIYKPQHVFIESDSECFGVRFRPGRAYRYAGVPISELKNGEVFLYDLKHNSSIFDIIAFERSFERQIELFRTHILPDIEFQPSPLMNYLLKRIYETSGNIRIDELSRETLYSERYINMTFNKFEGVSPKNFSKALRFNLSLNEITKGGYLNLTSVANENGYYDQSHFLRDFERYSPIPLKTYLKSIESCNYRNKLIVI